MKAIATLMIAAAAIFGTGCTAYVDPTPPVTTSERTTTTESTYVPGVGSVTERTTTRRY